MGRLFRTCLVAVCATVVLAPGLASAAVDWGPQRTVADWSWSSGPSLARTGDGSSVVVHQLFSTDNVDGSFATDHGPYQGVFLTSSDDRGQSWSSPQRVSQGTRHADRGALAASGSTLYAAWVGQASYDHYDPAARRILYFRADPGATPGGWGPTVRLSKQKGRVDAPAVAASGKRAYVAWTDANTGDLRIASTDDRGKTWSRDVLGKARANDPGGEGHVGLPAVGAAGKSVGVAWLATGNGAVRARISKNGGRTWSQTITLAPSGGAVNGGSPGVAGSGNRLVFTWTTPAGVWVRTWTSGAWSVAGARRGVRGGGGALGRVRRAAGDRRRRRDRGRLERVQLRLRPALGARARRAAVRAVRGWWRGLVRAFRGARCG